MWNGFPVRVTTRGEGFQVVTTPYPIHSGTVTPLIGRWFVNADTFIGTEVFRWERKTEALQWLARQLCDAYRRDMAQKFTGPQRRAMGMGQCPAHRPCRDRSVCHLGSTVHAHLCQRSPADPTTVYCDDHAGPP